MTRTMGITFPVQTFRSFVWRCDQFRHVAALKKLIDCVLLPLLSLFLFGASFNRYIQSVVQRIAVSKIACQIDNIVFYVGVVFSCTPLCGGAPKNRFTAALTSAMGSDGQKHDSKNDHTQRNNIRVKELSDVFTQISDSQNSSFFRARPGIPACLTSAFSWGNSICPVPPNPLALRGTVPAAHVLFRMLGCCGGFAFGVLSWTFVCCAPVRLPTLPARAQSSKGLGHLACRERFQGDQLRCKAHWPNHLAPEEHDLYPRWGAGSPECTLAKSSLTCVHLAFSFSCQT